MRIYLAAPYAAREQVRGYRDELHRIGFKVTSSWLDEDHDIAPGTVGAATDLDDATVAMHAEDDLHDIREADLFVMLTAAAADTNGATSTSGGRHVETGYAIGHLGTTRVIVVGEPENVFHRMVGVTVCPTWHEAVVNLSGRLVAHVGALPQAADR